MYDFIYNVYTIVQHPRTIVMPAIADIGRIMTETLTLGPLLLNITGNGSQTGQGKEPKQCSSCGTEGAGGHHPISAE